jgi:hypothetical protein
MMMCARAIETDVLTFVSLAIVVTMDMFEADAVFLLARTIVEGMKQIMLYEKGEGTEDGASIDSG